MAPLDRLRTVSVAAQILLLQLVVVAVVVIGGLGLAVVDARRDAVHAAGDVTLGVAETIAASPTVVAGARSGDPTALLQSYAEQVRVSTGTSFVVVMSTDGIRWTHPDPTQIGGRYLGTIEAARGGATLTEEYTGTLGRSVRSVVPVVTRTGWSGWSLPASPPRACNGRSGRACRRSCWPRLGALLVGTAGAFGISRRLRRQTRGLGETQLVSMLEYYDAVLHAVREGMLLLDPSGKVQLANDEARRLLALPTTRSAPSSASSTCRRRSSSAPAVRSRSGTRSSSCTTRSWW